VDEFSFVLVFLPVSVLPLVVMATVLGLDMRDLQAQRALLIGSLSSMVCVFLVYRLYQRRLAERRLRAAMAKQARTDDLTGLGNRRSLMEELKREVGRSGRTGAPLALLMVDLDWFKQVNDRFGHEVGDVVLRLFGHAMRAATRDDQDLLFRNGGDEFLVLLPDTGLEQAEVVGGRLR
jgi:PleD family two-component response regulator